MALIECSECGAQVSDKAKVCVKCGCPLRTESKVLVYGYTQSFMINPKVNVYIGGERKGSVSRGGMLECEIAEDTAVEFKCSFRTAKVDVQAGKVTRIKITWNRLTGGMVPQVVDTVTGESDNFSGL